MGSWWTKERWSVGGGTHISHRDLALQFATAGQSKDSILAADEKEAAEHAEKNEKARLAKIDDQVMRLREMYGVGDSQLAIANRGKINAATSGVETATVQGGERRINEGFAAEDRGRRMMLAERGITGGAIDATSQAKALQVRTEQRQQVALAGQQAKAALIDSLRTRRLMAESALRSGGQVGLDALTLAQQQAYQISEARAGVIPSNIGQGFSTVGRIYQYNQQARAAGGTGTDMWGNTDSSSTASRQPQQVNTNRTQSRN